MAVRAGNRVFLRGQTGSTFDGGFTGYGDPAAQTDQAMRNIARLLEEAGAKLEDICKVTTLIADRAFREPVGRHLKGIFPVGTGRIVDGFASPHVLVEIDAEAVIS